MSITRRRVKKISKYYKKLSNQFLRAIKKPIIRLLRNIFIPRRRQVSVNSGFVLPTVVMVALVVVLLTTAILFRSFERAKNASNVRVNEAVISAASPAIDRAKAKINQLFNDPRLPRSTPSDLSLSQVISDNVNQYTFGDETQLELVSDVNKDGTINLNSTTLDTNESLNTAWKYPVDTDNNGKFDSYTLYSIYFRTPSTTRPRSPLEARTQPMDEGTTGNQCSNIVATSADLIGSQGWYKVGSKLKRSFFVYTTTVPITDNTGLDNIKYEKYTGNKGFAALEYQQDRERIPLNNNAVLYEDDLEIAPGAGLNLNGRVFTNGNLLTRPTFTAIRFYLVSSPKSCYFNEQNSKVVVAGNVINSRVSESSSTSGSAPQVDLFDQSYTPTSSIQSDTISDTNKTVTSSVYGNTAAFNDAAYAQRINRLVDATISQYPNNTSLPDEVQQGINQQLAGDLTLSAATVRDQQLTTYFRKRTRRVPYAEIPFAGDPLKYTKNGKSYDYTTTSPLQGSGNSLRPVDEWVFPFDPSSGTDASDYGVLAMHTNGNSKLYLPATDPAQEAKANKEQKIGDRVLVGNSLPQFWYDTTQNAFVSSTDKGQTINGRQWDIDQNGNNSTVTRQRISQAYQLDDLGVTDRDQFWEKSAAQQPQGSLDVVGGLRVITGAGIYLPNDYIGSAHTFTNTQTTVWADTMPSITTQAQGLPNDKTPYLQMRATVAYHYQDSSYDPKTPTTYQTPIACISSYYDPTSSTTARNKLGLPDISLRNTNRDLTGLANVSTNPGNSNNGVVYSASSLSTTGYSAELNYQAQLKYPNGRWVNEPLKNALADIAASKSLTLSEQSAVDSAMCALKILDATIGTPTDTKVPHGAIMETAFLDARQIKAIDKPTSTSSTTYDLDVELRQPLEIRATVIDLDLLRRKSKSNGEFLFPNSGIIYASRDDALSDLSDSSQDLDLSARDFKLDPTRRPNGIMLINGSDLSRNSTYKPEEKGLILATNLSVYIQGNFNQHTQEEFTDNSLKNQSDWSGRFYKRQTLNSNFACRAGQFSTCSTGESWRPASVIADSITVLSSNFRLGFREEGDYNLRDNYGNFPIGYDFDGSGGNPNSSTNVTLDETAIKFDVNGNGNMTDTSVSTLDETVLGVDLNGNGNKTNTSVQITESNITATVAARLNGFWDNNFVTSHDFTDSQYSGSTSGRVDSSYLNNFVTPIQRRAQFSEYVMEMCPKLTLTACTPSDWVVGYDLDGKNGFSDSEKIIKANQLIQALSDAGIPSVQTTKLRAGTTATPATDPNDPNIQRYPRRVAFLRYGNGLTATKGGKNLSGGADNTLVLDDDKTPIPIGISTNGNSSNIQVNYFPFSNTIKINNVTYQKYDTSNSSSNPNRPRQFKDDGTTANNALWFRTSTSSNSFTSATATYDQKYPLWIANTLTGTRPTEQPLLIPVLQIQYPFISPSDTNSLNDTGDAKNSGNWMQTATNTETNLVFAQGNTPERPVETNGGLENFVRFLERWQGVNHTASGAFIQFKRSSYATAPWQIVTADYNTDQTGYTSSSTGTIFGYPQGYRLTVTNVSGKTLGRSPFYAAPTRFWGYDVALLSQLPDLFSQRFTTPATNQPNEFYREVGRDDTWMKTLLCAAQNQSVGGYNTAPSASYGTNYNYYALSRDQRSSTCP
jgi:hypothetical protein